MSAAGHSLLEPDDLLANWSDAPQPRRRRGPSLRRLAAGALILALAGGGWMAQASRATNEFPPPALLKTAVVAAPAPPEPVTIPWQGPTPASIGGNGPPLLRDPVEEPGGVSRERAGSAQVLAAPPPIGTAEAAGPTPAASALAALQHPAPTTAPDNALRVEGPAIVEPIAAASEHLERATVRTAVNLRGGPNNRAPVLTVVPANSSVDVVRCEYWCEVRFLGQTGWIYKSFIAN